MIIDPRNQSPSDDHEFLQLFSYFTLDTITNMCIVPSALDLWSTLA